MSTRFNCFPWVHGNVSDLLSVWTESIYIDRQNATHYGFVCDGIATLSWGNRHHTVCAGEYFCVPGKFSLRTQSGRGILMHRDGYRGIFMLGGPVERRGRLRYINQCSDTTLVQPVRRGDPCLNLLYFPPDIYQTAHTHPSDRIGVVVSGRGSCHVGRENFKVPLNPGTIFHIEPECLHRFSTDAGEELRVIAYHPDSDCGPDDDNHAMINRTIVDGVAARNIPDIRTVGLDTLER